MFVWVLSRELAGHIAPRWGACRTRLVPYKHSTPELPQRQRNLRVLIAYERRALAQNPGAHPFSRPIPVSNDRLLHMEKKTLTASAVLLFCLVLVSVAPASPAQSHKPSREEAEKVIRATAYEMMKAFLTSDIQPFKRHSAKRMLDLVVLVFEAARQDPRYQQELQNARIANADQFLGFFLQGMATQYLQAMPLSPEAAA